jgi:hypothetical protein
MGTRGRGSVVSSSIKSSDLYRIGLVLHELPNSSDAEAVQRSYHHLLSKLPVQFRNDLFASLLKGLILLGNGNGSSSDDDLELALSAVSQLYQASTLAGATAECTLDAIQSLSASYNGSTSAKQQGLISFLAFLLRLENPTLDQEHLLTAINTLQVEKVWADMVHHLNQTRSTWKSDLLQALDADQRDYFASMLDAMDGDASDCVTTWSHPESKAKPQKVKQHTKQVNDPMQQLIDQVGAIIPGLGEGFLETALSVYKGNVEQTISALLQLDDPIARKELPAQLLVTDRNLPRRRKVTPKQVAAEEEEAKAVAKANVRAVEREQQEEANLMSKAMIANEYDDDYDDQWDDDDGMAAGADSGLYDDYNAVKTYNKVYREMEANSAYWEDNRNTNRDSNNNNNKTSTTTETKAFRGPDKIRGGRVPDANGGGGGGRGGGRGRGRGGRGRKSNNNDKNEGGEKKDGNAATTTATDDKKDEAKNSRRIKERTLANRRDQQKKSMYKQSG